MGSAVIVPLLVQALPAFAPLLGGPLLGRLPLSAEEVLGSPVRQEILRTIRRDPGIPLGELKQAVGIGWGSLYHHMAKLQRTEQVRIVMVGRRRIVYPAGSQAADAARVRTILSGETARRVAEAVLRRPGSSIRDLVEEVDESPRVVYYHVKRLLDAGLLHSASPTRHFDLTPGPRLAEHLREAPPDSAVP